MLLFNICSAHFNKCLCSLLIQVAKYLLDSSRALDEESLYEASLRIEPKTSS